MFLPIYSSIEDVQALTMAPISHDRRPEVLFEYYYPVQCPTLSVQPHVFGARQPRHALDLPGEESVVVESFAAWVNALGPLSQVSPTLRARLFREVAKVARHVNVSTETGTASGYGRRVLYEDPQRWSLAAISLRPGQSTELHDHSSWGCAVTVQGIERNRCFAQDASGNLVLSSEHDYPQGTGYVFEAVDVHQPLGADPERVTVALHFLVHVSHTEPHAHAQARPEAPIQEVKAEQTS
jgi:predicted metal-dependent enzyme (double-stranded beta helix superfamily)